jgi:hypothetical protein
MKICAGAWLNCVVCIERTTASSSDSAAKLGVSSVKSCPDAPYFANLYGDARILGVPLMNAKRSPFVKLSGIGCRSSSASLGLGSKRSSCDGAPAMCR